MAQKRNKNTRRSKKPTSSVNSRPISTQNFAKLATGEQESTYGYTLQTIPCNLTQSETHNAQLEMFAQGNKVAPKTWAILAFTSVLGIAGVAYFKGMQTIFFWLLLIGVAIYFLIKFVGIKQYMKRELAKQPFPDELKHVKLGLQPHGLVLSMPQDLAMEQMNQQMGGKSSKSMMTMMKKNAGRDIPWKDMTEWKETNNFYMVMFEVNGQQGSQLIPKRMKNDNFPMAKLAEHLTENVTKTS